MQQSYTLNELKVLVILIGFMAEDINIDIFVGKFPDGMINVLGTFHFSYSCLIHTDIVKCTIYFSTNNIAIECPISKLEEELTKVIKQYGNLPVDYAKKDANIHKLRRGANPQSFEEAHAATMEQYKEALENLSLND